MVSLGSFPNSLDARNVSICEKNGRICSMPIDQLDISEWDINMQEYPDINISREMHHLTSHHYQYPGCSRNVMVPVDESNLKKIIRIYFEHGLKRTLEEAKALQLDKSSPILEKIIHSLLYCADLSNKLHNIISPNLRENVILNLTTFSETREWNKSSIRYVDWHKVYSKVAVAASDDSIRIYTIGSNQPIVLKHPDQKYITAMRWRPYTLELAVGCESGFLLWIIDSLSVKTRPQALIYNHDNHFPITSIDWSPTGKFLATASFSSASILIWDVDMRRSTVLNRMGPGCNLVRWSSNGQWLCSTTVGNVFRVFNTMTWEPERWTIGGGNIQSCAWSPCGNYLLFVTSEDPFLYKVSFKDENLFSTKNISKLALSVADLSKIALENGEIGGRPQQIVWDHQGRNLVVTFKDSSSMALFNTVINNYQFNISPSAFLTGIGVEHPTFITFREAKEGSVLTIGWSSGRIQYFPFFNY